MDYEDETPLAEQLELDGDEHGDFDPVLDMYDNEFLYGHQDDSETAESAALAADRESE
jgi:hypothetical protein